MELIPTIINALVVAVVGGLLMYVTRDQIKDLKDDLREVKQDIRDLRLELSSEVASVRSDLTQIALAVGAQARPQTG